MTTDIGLLAATAASIGVIHTILGPDHYLPFAAMARARGWSAARTLWITSICGVGHVIGSIVLGGVGLAIGVSLDRLEWIEAIRGDVAAWLLTGFGLAYAAWGLRRAWRNRPHTHVHEHADGTQHVHEHRHHDGHLHVHEAAALSITPWALFVIFAFGPCEPLIPVLMYPASQANWASVALVAVIFAVATIATMLAAVMLTRRGLAAVSIAPLARYSHALAGGAIFLCGVGILALGL
ncbi:MAG TPA: sulfite exporter TauE/SafE family protein [Steroidobacteraceae bacterium]|nr:sulfite exporter TauE/SafE family protein [Steroidobacteraceae bacterium]